MSVTTETNKIFYEGNGITDTFFFPFPVLEAEHLKVNLRAPDGTETESLLDATDGHFVLLEMQGEAGASVTFTSPPQDEHLVLIRRIVPLTQDAEYTAGDPFPAESHERVLDHRAMAEQQLQEQLSRVIKVPETDQSEDLLLPNEIVRANKLFGFDDLGAPEAVTKESLITDVLSVHDDASFVGTIGVNKPLNFAANLSATLDASGGVAVAVEGGQGSGLDADLFDGRDSADFAKLGAADANLFLGEQTFNHNVTFKADQAIVKFNGGAGSSNTDWNLRLIDEGEAGPIPPTLMLGYETGTNSNWALQITPSAKILRSDSDGLFYDGKLLAFDTGNPGNVPDASTTEKGIIEIATQAEVDSGGDSERAVTPTTLNTWAAGASGFLPVTGGTLTGNLRLANDNGIIEIARGDGTVAASWWTPVGEPEKPRFRVHDPADPNNWTAMRLEHQGDLFWRGLKLWGQHNDGSGSGLDADLLHGFIQSDQPTANTLARRQNDGSLLALTEISAQAPVANGESAFVLRGGGGAVRSEIRYDGVTEGLSLRLFGGAGTLRNEISLNADGSISINGQPLLTGGEGVLADPGYQVFGNGLILQWLNAAAGRGVPKFAAFPMTFPNAVLGVVTGETGGDAVVAAVTASGVSLQGPAGAEAPNTSAFCLSIGY
ncbi:gp53-like domain-containing protein [Limibacillus halophilus]|uniref:Putative tail fiber protein gp53-like C-terminal domain-containing protein n=1 Tax=Limibacillus halophilus TaxID=1579333 RepID=A0A839SS34_9PROT|nr:hypothetical protein [Limibacillus halophilus]MBB3065601.1 hypothetical protein [Limibacillus halophilus]